MCESNHDLDSAADDIIQQAEELCDLHTHITRVVGELDIPQNVFADQYSRESGEQIEFEGLLKCLIYMWASEFSQQQLSQRLRTWSFLQARFGLEEPPTQQAISYSLRHRLSLNDRQKLSTVADAIRNVAVEHNLLAKPYQGPSLEPEEINEGHLTDDEIKRAVQIARKRVFTEFTTKRAENAKYEDDVFWELQAYLSMTEHGKRDIKRRAARLSWRGETPHGDTHTRTIKQMGTPESQTKLSQFTNGGQKNWKRIRKTLLDPFDQAIQNLIEQTDLVDHISEPVNVAIDITPWQFYPSPWKYRDYDFTKDDYPEMVSGLKDSNERGYKFATLTVVGEDTPFVLAIEPVKEESNWEDNPERTPIADVVDRLLSKAEEHLDIHKVMADREFYNHRVRSLIDQRDMTYIIPKPTQANFEFEDIENIKEHPDADRAVKSDVPVTVDGRTHFEDLMYMPTDGDNENYAIFTTNTDVSDMRIRQLTSQYRNRWMIENEYKSIKAHFLPRTCSTDYRVRLFYFVAAVLMYNVWRLTNLLLREMVDVDLGEKPPIPAGEVTEILCIYCDESIG